MSDKSKSTDELLGLINGPIVTSITDAMRLIDKKKQAGQASTQPVQAQSTSDKSTQSISTSKAVETNNAVSAVQSPSKSKKAKSPAVGAFDIVLKKEQKHRKKSRGGYINDNRQDSEMLRMQQLNLSYPIWKNAGLSSFLLLTHSHDNKVHKHNPKTLISRRYVNEYNLNANTERFGITTDKGFIGFTGDVYKNHKLKPIKNMLGLTPTALEDIFKPLDKEQGTYLQKHMDAGYLTEAFTDNDKIGIKEKIKSNSFTLTKAAEYNLEMYESIPAHINLYLINDIIFTTTTMLHAGCIDASQIDTTNYLPCSGLIQDILTKILLSTEYNTYYQNVQKQTFTETTKNSIVEDSEEIVTSNIFKESFGYVYNVRENRTGNKSTIVTIPATFFPITTYQRGNSNNPLINVNFNQLDINVIEESLQNISASEIESRLDVIKKSLPVGDIIPLARLFTREGSEEKYILPLSMDETNCYPLHTLNLNDVLIISESALKSYSESDLISIDKLTMYSQAIVDVVQYIKQLTKLTKLVDEQKEEEVGNILTATTNLTQSTTSNLLDHATYTCPTALSTSLEFII